MASLSERSFPRDWCTDMSLPRPLISRPHHPAAKLSLQNPCQFVGTECSLDTLSLGVIQFLPREPQEGQLPKVSVIMTSRITRNSIIVTRKNWRGRPPQPRKRPQRQCDTLFPMTGRLQRKEATSYLALTAAEDHSSDCQVPSQAGT